MLCCGLEKNGMVGAWYWHGMACVNQTRPHCVNQMGKTHSKPLAARHGGGKAWARHAMYESAFNLYVCFFSINSIIQIAVLTRRKKCGTFNSISQMHQHRYLGATVCLEVYFRDFLFYLMTEANSKFKAPFIFNHNKMLKTSTPIIKLINTLK